jgi:hypothetical protein
MWYLWPRMFANEMLEDDVYCPNWRLRSLTVWSLRPLFGWAGKKYLDCRPNVCAAFCRAMPLVRSVVIDSQEHGLALET